MVDVGHPVDLYTYHPELLQDLPASVSIRDARELFPIEATIFHRETQSPALFSDIFRYRGLQLNLGIWADTDIFLLRNLDDLEGTICGWENDIHINNAVLYLPADHPFLARYISLFDQKVPILPHWKMRRKLDQMLRSLIGRHQSLPEMKWGSTGPRAITYGAKRYGFDAYPPDYFYPLPFAEAKQSFNPLFRVEDRMTENTRAVHLWHSKIKPLISLPAPHGSFVEKHCRRLQISTTNAPPPARP